MSTDRFKETVSEYKKIMVFMAILSHTISKEKTRKLKKSVMTLTCKKCKRRFLMLFMAVMGVFVTPIIKSKKNKI